MTLYLWSILNTEPSTLVPLALTSLGPPNSETLQSFPGFLARFPYYTNYVKLPSKIWVCMNPVFIILNYQKSF